MEFMGLVGLMVSITLAKTEPVTKPSDEVFVASECYGNTLSVMCRRGYRIRVVDDFFGVSSSGAQCSHTPGDCTVVNGRGSSVVHRYCQGKQECTTFQVDRRYCGLNLTSYEQVEYQCISESDITDMCSSVDFVTNSGYFASPNFPYEYPANLDCQCTLQSLNSGQRVRLEAIHFTIKYDSPCRDWLEIASGHYRRRLCGAYRSTLVSDRFRLSLHTDKRDSHQGLWLFFNVYPDTAAKGNIRVRCYNPDAGDNDIVDNVDFVTKTQQLSSLSAAYTHSDASTTHTSLQTESVNNTTLHSTFMTSASQRMTPRVARPVTTHIGVTSPLPMVTRMTTSFARTSKTGSARTTPRLSRQAPVTWSKLLFPSNTTKHSYTSLNGSTLAPTHTTVHYAKGATRLAQSPTLNWNKKAALTTIRPSTRQIVFDYKNVSRDLSYRLHVTNAVNVLTVSTTRSTNVQSSAPTRTTTTTWHDTTRFHYSDFTQSDYVDKNFHVSVGQSTPSSQATVPARVYSEKTEQAGVADLTTMKLTTVYTTTHTEPLSTSMHTSTSVYNSTRTNLGTGHDTEAESQSYVDNKMTGIIIIAVSVGGILTLLIILAVLICVNKGRSKVPANNHASSLSQQQHRLTQRLQQRLNSLTFYDSIPLHDGQQRRASHVTRTGSSVRDMTSIASTATSLPSHDASSSDMTSRRQVAPFSQLQASANCSVLSGSEPYWASIQHDTESDCDAVAVTSVTEGALVFMDDGKRLDTPELTLTAPMSKTERQTPEGQAQASGLCINLQKSDSVDDVVYTHV